jgi:hypothetical protein
MTAKGPALRLAGAFALALATLSPATVLADVAPPRPTPTPTPTPVTNGWRELRPSDPELVAVARFVVPRLPVRRARLLRIEGGERQVVAGTNYRIGLQLTDRSRWLALVWRKPDGTYQLTRVGPSKVH